MALPARNHGEGEDIWVLRPNRYLLHRFKNKAFEIPKEHENLIRFPGKDFFGLDFKADSLNFSVIPAEGFFFYIKNSLNLCQGIFVGRDS
jgi:hypothetical protein